MKFYNIMKDGIFNVIDEGQYEAIYKPKGWKITGIVGEDTRETEIPTSPRDEIIKKNTNKMKRTAPKKFDDKLIKDNEDGTL